MYKQRRCSTYCHNVVMVTSSYDRYKSLLLTVKCLQYVLTLRSGPRSFNVSWLTARSAALYQYQRLENVSRSGMIPTSCHSSWLKTGEVCCRLCPALSIVVSIETRMEDEKQANEMFTMFVRLRNTSSFFVMARIAVKPRSSGAVS